MRAILDEIHEIVIVLRDDDDDENDTITLQPHLVAEEDVRGCYEDFAFDFVELSVEIDRQNCIASYCCLPRWQHWDYSILAC